MKTGDAVTDSQGRAWQIGEMLGRGLWGTSWSAHHGGREWVLKFPLRAADLPSDTPLPDGVVKASRDALNEQGELLRKAQFPFLARLEEKVSFTSGSAAGQPALVLQKYPSSLKRLLSAGALPLSEALQTIRAVSRLCESLGVHGNLRPSNILLNDRGEPVLSDVLTPACHAWWRKLEAAALDREPWLPPEADGSPRPVWDTWALCTLLYRAAMLPPGNREGRREERSPLPRNGLDRVELATVRDRILARLQEDQSNPRFGPRLAEAASKLLNRGLSREMEPSPPYRFDTIAAFRPRLEEIVDLVDPRIETVGQVLLAHEAKNGSFQGGDPVRFSVSIGVTAGVQTHEDIACGLQVVDLDAAPPGRVALADMAFTAKAQNPGRWRFDFSIPGLPPGRYRALAGFRIRDAEGEWSNASGDFEVRPPPGYVPPPEDPPSTVPLPLPMPARIAPEPAPTPMSRDTGDRPSSARDQEPPLELPRPIAPASGDKSSPTPIQPSRSTLGDTATDLSPGPTVSDSDADEPMAEPPRLQLRPTPPPVVVAPPPKYTPPAIAGLDAKVKPSGERSTAGVDRNSNAPAESTGAVRQYGAPAPVDWDDVNDARGVNESFVPGHGGADLPEIDPPTAIGANPVAALVERALEFIRKDYYSAFMIGITMLLMLLIAVYTLTRLL
jgi:hypothetical protein